MQNWEAFQTIINTPQKVVITTHQNPDADALGSSLGLGLYLQKKGHTFTVISPTDYPANLAWLPRCESVVVYNEKNRQQCTDLVAEATVVFCLDFNALQRINELGEIVKNAPATKVMIDHHLFPEAFADIVFSDTHAAATAQMIVEIIERMGDKHLIDKQIAECLYAGIMTDTGSFRHPSTTRESHLAVVTLMDAGLEVNPVHRRIFDNAPFNRLKLLGHVLSQNMVYLPEYNTIYMTISEAELKQFDSKYGDTEGIVNYGLQIQNVVMAVLMIEREREIKMSFRSVEYFSVRDVASAHFEGGGHKNASGGRTKLSLAETVEKLLSILPQYKIALTISPQIN